MAGRARARHHVSGAALEYPSSTALLLVPGGSRRAAAGRAERARGRAARRLPADEVDADLRSRRSCSWSRRSTGAASGTRSGAGDRVALPPRCSRRGSSSTSSTTTRSPRPRRARSSSGRSSTRTASSTGGGRGRADQADRRAVLPVEFLGQLDVLWVGSRVTRSSRRSSRGRGGAGPRARPAHAARALVLRAPGRDGLRDARRTLLSANWPSFNLRYLYPLLPALAVAVAAAVPRGREAARLGRRRGLQRALRRRLDRHGGRRCTSPTWARSSGSEPLA